MQLSAQHISAPRPCRLPQRQVCRHAVAPSLAPGPFQHEQMTASDSHVTELPQLAKHLSPPNRQPKEPPSGSRQHADPHPGFSMQPGRTSAELVAKRAQRLREAQQLTVALRSACRWTDLELLFQQHRGQMNHIHMSALLSRLAHLGQAPQHHPQAATRSPASQPVRWGKQEAPAIHLFLSAVVPFIGMHLLSLGPRQLATIMWALGSLGFTPQPAWVVEWSNCVARKLPSFTPQDLAMSAWGLVASGAIHLGTASGAPGALLQLTAAAARPELCSQLRATDVSNLCWALGTSGMRQDPRILQALLSRATTILQHQARCHTASHTQQGAPDSDCATPPCLAGPSGSQQQLPTTATAWGAAPALREAALQAFLPVEITNMLWALAKVSYHPGPELLALATTCFLHSATSAYAAQPQQPQRSPDMHSGALTSTAQPQQASLQSASRQQSGSTASTEPKHCAIMLWALARLRARPGSQQIAALLSGSLYYRPSVSSGTAHRGVAAGRPHSLSSADLAQVVWAMGRLQYQPPRSSWQQLLPATVAALQATAQEADMLWDTPPVKPLHSHSKRARHRYLFRMARWRQRHPAEVQEQESADPEADAPGVAQWLAAMHGTAATPAAAATPLTAAELVMLLSGLSRLRLLRLPPPLRHVLRSAAPPALAAISSQLQRVPVSSQLQLLTSCALLHVRPPLRFMCTWAKRCTPALHALSAAQIASVLKSLVLVKRRPTPAFLIAASQQSYHLMQPPETSTSSAVAPSITSASTPQPSDRHQVVPVYTPGPAPGGTSNDNAAAVAAESDARASGGGAGGGEITGHWRGSVESFVTVLWALSKLRAGPVKGAWADSAVHTAMAATPHLRPAQLSRLLDALRTLRARPTRELYQQLTRRYRAAVRQQRRVLRCDEPCNAWTEAPCEAKACDHLAHVPAKLSKWRWELGAMERKMNIRLCRSFRKRR